MKISYYVTADDAVAESSFLLGQLDSAKTISFGQSNAWLLLVIVLIGGPLFLALKGLPVDFYFFAFSIPVLAFLFLVMPRLQRWSYFGSVEKQKRSFVENGGEGLREAEFDESGFALTKDGVTTRNPWRNVSRIESIPQLIIFLRESPGVCGTLLTMPVAAFRNAHDREEFLTRVREMHAAAVAHPTVATGEDAPSADLIGKSTLQPHEVPNNPNAIQLQTTHDLDEFTTILRAINGQVGSRPWLWTTFIVVIFTLIGLIRHFGDPRFGLLLPLLAFALVIPLFWAIRRRNAMVTPELVRKMLGADSFQTPTLWTFDNKGIRVSHNGHERARPWQQFCEVRLHELGILLRNSENQYEIIPRRAFADDSQFDSTVQRIRAWLEQSVRQQATE